MDKHLSAIFLCVLFLIPSYLVSASARRNPAVFSAGNAPRTVRQKAALVDVKGKVVILRAGVTITGRAGTAIRPGDVVQLMTAGSRAVILTDTGSQIRLKGVTNLLLVDLFKKPGGTVLTRLQLLAGRIWAQVKKLKTRDSTFEIKSGGVVCGVRGTILGCQFDPERHAGSFYNYEGDVFVTAGGMEREIGEGMGCGFGEGRLGDMAPIPPQGREDFNFRGYNHQKAQETLDQCPDEDAETGERGKEQGQGKGRDKDRGEQREKEKGDERPGTGPGGKESAAKPAGTAGDTGVYTEEKGSEGKGEGTSTGGTASGEGPSSAEGPETVPSGESSAGAGQDVAGGITDQLDNMVEQTNNIDSIVQDVQESAIDVLKVRFANPETAQPVGGD